MNEQNNPILEVKNLRVSYHTYAGEVKAVRGVQFSLEKGQALAIVGESGCGKSVTAKSIMGLIKAPQGEIKENSEILYHGENILKYNKKQWQHYKGGEWRLSRCCSWSASRSRKNVSDSIRTNFPAVCVSVL